jgi:hypothetical protein
MIYAVISYAVDKTLLHCLDQEAYSVSMEKNTHWGAHAVSTGQNIPRLLWYPKAVYYQVQRTLYWSILIQSTFSHQISLKFVLVLLGFGLVDREIGVRFPAGTG